MGQPELTTTDRVIIQPLTPGTSYKVKLNAEYCNNSTEKLAEGDTSTLKLLRCAEICYDDVGCFNNDTCYPFGFPPKTPEEIGTRFYLYTRSNKNDPQEISRKDVAGLRASFFDARRRTKFVVHGYTSDSFSSWEKAKRDALLQVENVNVISVDWGTGALGLYSKCHWNARVVGREIGLLARFLNLEAGMYYKDVHLIGMSLGAHVVGFAGEFQPGFARITGLDPAGPYFRDNRYDFRDQGPECRLDPTDALFVDVIHTDGNDILGAGQIWQLGHQDFYPNGGRHQAGCEGPDIVSGCSHMRAEYLFTDTILETSCSFTAYPCFNWLQFVRGKCQECGPLGCPTMGYYADQNMMVSGKFYLRTNGQSPFCIDE
ncbi:pancreatic lipase-related protein 2-like [Diadema antillarum]|uniref:pancreatic lipase-related protein 2-like n=1 Tax=Diadema antillarum TaxID=105358 RepID=UPI003A85BA6E